MFKGHRSTAVLAAALFAVLAPAGAHAGVLVESATDCEAQSSARVFLPWADVANYTLAPGGAGESSDGLSFSGGASIVDGNEPWTVRDAGDSRSISLPEGSSVTTGVMCVGVEHPTLRFFSKQNSGSLFDEVDVEVLFEDSLGLVQSLWIGQARTSSWQPTAVMAIPASLLPLLPGDRTPVAFRFTADGGDFQIDDVYVDPWGTR